jgi:DNA-binding transcriptional regulator YiaG
MTVREAATKPQSTSLEWTGEQIRALRLHMGLTQREMADELAVRQQTISEWETGVHQPHRSSQRTLVLIAERAGFSYTPMPEQIKQYGEA